MADLWAYEAASNRWVPLTPSGTPPPAWAGYTAVWDSVRERMLGFGGAVFEGYLGDLWSYAAGSNRWERLAPVGPEPPPR